MLLQTKPNHQIVKPDYAVNPQSTDANAPSKAELRRQLYESIAQGNTMAEVEEKANQRWQVR